MPVSKPKCLPCIAAADAKARKVSDVTGTSRYTFEITPWSVPINVNAKEGWAAAGVQMGTIAIGYKKVPGRNGYYYMPAGTTPHPLFCVRLVLSSLSLTLFSTPQHCTLFIDVVEVRLMHHEFIVILCRLWAEGSFLPAACWRSAHLSAFAMTNGRAQVTLIASCL